jgi:hypothetical protein
MNSILLFLILLSNSGTFTHSYLEVAEVLGRKALFMP